MSALLSRDRFVLVLALALAALGLSQWLTMPRQEDPSLTDRFAILVVTRPGSDVLSMERLVADPIEDALAEIDEVDTVRVTLRSEAAIFVIELRDEVSETSEIWTDVEAALERARAELPDGVLPYDFRHDGTETESVLVALTGSADRIALDDAAQALRRRLLGEPLVARVVVSGAPDEEIAVELEERALRAHDLDREQVIGLLASRSDARPGGSVVMGSQSVDIRPGAELPTLEAIRATPIPISADTSLPLGELARVSRRPSEPPSELARYQGHPAVLLGVVPRAEIDVVAFGQAVRDAIASSPLPPGIEVEEIAYQPANVAARLSNLQTSLVQALLVVAGVLVLFMGVRLGGVVATVVPLVALSAVAVYALGGGVLHQMSIAALVMSIGLLVDNAIVVAEDIQRRIDEGAPHAEAARAAVRALAWPLFTSTGTTIAAFVPMLIAVGPSGEFTRAIPIMVGLTLVLSYLFAVAVTPALASRFLRRRPASASQDEDPSKGLAARVGRLAAQRPGIALALAMGALALGITTAGRVGRDFFPSSDSELLIVTLTLPEGTAISQTDQVTRQVESWLRERPETLALTTFVGRGTPRFYYNLQPSPQSPHLAEIIVRTPDAASVRSLQEAVRAQARARVPEAQVVARRLEQGPPVVAPVEVRLYGDDLTALGAEAAALEALLRDVPGTTDVRSTRGTGMPTLEVEVDDASAMRSGVTRAEVASALYGRTRGLPIATFRGGDDPVPIVVHSGAGAPTRTELLAIGVDVPGRAPVPLADVARVHLTHTPASITHRNRRRALSVYAQTLPGVTYAQVVARLEPMLRDRQWSAGVDWEMGGAAESSGEANAALGAGAPFGILLLIAFLLLEFNSIRRTLVILASAPLAVMGAWPGLLLAGQPFGFVALLGVIALIGIVVNNAIVLVDYADERRREGVATVEALADAVRVRVRPILLTTATTVLGFVPLLDSRSTLWPPMAAAMISGLLIATPLTLFVIPALYRLLVRDTMSPGSAEPESPSVPASTALVPERA